MNGAENKSLENKFRCLLFERSSKSDDNAASFAVLYSGREGIVYVLDTSSAVASEATKAPHQTPVDSDMGGDCVRLLVICFTVNCHSLLSLSHENQNTINIHSFVCFCFFIL